MASVRIILHVVLPLVFNIPVEAEAIALPSPVTPVLVASIGWLYACSIEIPMLEAESSAVEVDIDRLGSQISSPIKSRSEPMKQPLIPKQA